MGKQKYLLTGILAFLFIYVDAMQETSQEQQTTESEPVFNLKNLGKPITVLGILRNKKSNSIEPLFANFGGGEWVVAPLREEKRLCAAIFEGFTSPGSNNCRLIIRCPKDYSTDFNYANLPLTSLFLVRKHFDLDAQGRPFKFIGPSENELWFEFINWIENNPPPMLFTERKNNFDRPSRRCTNQRPKTSRISIAAYEEDQEDTYTKATKIAAANPSSSTQKPLPHNTYSWLVATASTSLK